MAGQMWFGNRRYMQWVPCPETGADYNQIGALQSMDYLNGGAFRRRSATGAKQRRLTWSLTSRDKIRTITDFAEGVYGDGPIYWVDPFTMDKNVLPQSFATPSLGGTDGVPLIDGVRPTILPTATPRNGYPIDSARYDVVAGQTARRVYIPVPPGHDMYIGAHGDVASTVGLSLYPVMANGSSGAAFATVAVTAPSDARFSYAFTIPNGYSGVEVAIDTTADGFIGLAGVMVQIMPPGRVPTTNGPFISGQGMSGAEWEEMPTVNAYSAAMDLVGMSATFTEVEQWL